MYIKYIIYCKWIYIWKTFQGAKDWMATKWFLSYLKMAKFTIMIIIHFYVPIKVPTKKSIKSKTGYKQKGTDKATSIMEK